MCSPLAPSVFGAQAGLDQTGWESQLCPRPPCEPRVLSCSLGAGGGKVLSPRVPALQGWEAKGCPAVSGLASTITGSPVHQEEPLVGPGPARASYGTWMLWALRSHLLRTVL